MGFQYFVDDNGYSFARPCPTCGPVDTRIQKFNDARIPAKYASNSAFDQFEYRKDGKAIGNLQKVHLKLYKYATEYAPGAPGLVLWGGVGTGKTHLLASVIRHLTIEKGVSARFIEFTHLLSQIRETYETGVGETTVMAPVINAEVLAIDELGKGRANDWQTSVIDEIISKRYNAGLTTLATTNYPLTAANPDDAADLAGMKKAMAQETLSSRVGDRIFSRLQEMAEFVHVSAPDFRAG